MRSLPMVAATALSLLASSAAAQPRGGEVEAGATATRWLGSTSVSGYVGGALLATDRISLYGAIHAGVEGYGRGGIALRLGSSTWRLRPALRAGVIGAEAVFGTAGFSVTVGRRAGMRFAVDWGRPDPDYGAATMLLHGGFYVRF